MRKVIWILIILTLLISTTGCGKTAKEKALEEDREFLDFSYYEFTNEDDSAFSSKYDDFIEDNEDKFIRWTVPVVKIESNKELHLMEKDLPNVKVHFKYKVVETDSIKTGDVITFSGNIKNYIHGLFGTTPVWEVENARLEKTNEQDKKVLLAYQESLKKNKEEDTEQEVSSNIITNEEEKLEEDKEQERILEMAKELEVGHSAIDGATGMVITRKKDGVYIGDKLVIANNNLEDSSNKDNIILGLDAASIKINLKNRFNLEFTGPEPLPNSKLYVDSGEYLTENTFYHSEIYAETPSKISFVTFTIGGSDLSNVETYLGYCATILYEGAEQKKSQDWVQSNYKKLETGETIVESFGEVRYELSKGAGGSSLAILAKGVE